MSQTRQIRIFVLPAESSNNWVENVVGKIIKPVIEAYSIDWFWFSRYGEGRPGSEADCNLEAIASEYNHRSDLPEGAWRSVRFRFASDQCAVVEQHVLNLIAQSPYDASGFIDYAWKDDLAGDRMLSQPRTEERKTRRAELMAKTLNAVARIYIDSLEQSETGDFFQETNNSYPWGMMSSLEPLRHLIVDMTHAPTQVVVARRADGSLEPLPHPIGEPQVYLEIQGQGIRVLGHPHWHPPYRVNPFPSQP